ncbi:MAG: UDP-2,3-diacylglucosamine diphosphatase [Gemmatimonadaceae bacterium]|nr:UDP-2,3-diacylglucosamine diphosphatase [Gemmatimonadaceae bacterium]
MLPAPCYIVSDAHLGVAPRASEHGLVSFLRHARQDARSLVINGDLFDFWFEWRSVIPRIGYRVLAEVAAFADAGIPVLWVAGNHDCWGGQFLRDDAGIDYRFGPWRGTIGGWQVRIDHGDGLRGAEDRRYRFVRPLLRNRAAIWAYRHLLHPDWASRIALGTSATSRTYSAADNGEGLKRVAFRDLAADRALDLIVFGHSHVPALVASPTGGLYGNAGTWLGDSTYLRLADEHVTLLRWKGSHGEPIAHHSRPAPAEA